VFESCRARRLRLNGLGDLDAPLLGGAKKGIRMDVIVPLHTRKFVWPSLKFIVWTVSLTAVATRLSRKRFIWPSYLTPALRSRMPTFAADRAWRFDDTSLCQHLESCRQACTIRSRQSGSVLAFSVKRERQPASRARSNQASAAAAGIPPSSMA